MQTNKSQNYNPLNSVKTPVLPNASQTNTTKTPMNMFQLGQVLKGQIIDLQRQDITILLSNGQLLKGRLEDASLLSITDNAEFVVANNQNSKIVLKLLSKTPADTTDLTIDKALEEANLVKTERNSNVVNALLKQQMPIDKNTIQTVLRQTSMFKNASLDTIVLMNKFQIPLNETNTSQLEAYRNFEHQLMTQVKSLSSSILTDLSTMPPEVAHQFHQEIISIVLDMPNLSTPNTAVPEEALLKESIALNVMTEEAIPSKNNTEELIQTMIQSKVSPFDARLSDATTPKEFNSIYEAITSSLEPDFLNELEQSLFKHSSSFPTEAQDHPLLKQLFKLSPENILASKEYQSIVDNLLMKTFSLSTKQLLDNNEISHFYERAEEKLEKLRHFFAQFGETRTEGNYQATNSIHQLKDNIDFMKAMNQFFGYVQLPMKLPSQYTNGELFVYTNKKQLLDGNKNISVLLHLNMEHLGPLDFHLSLFLQQVTAKVSFVKEDSLTLLTQHMPQLQQTLQSKGYTFDYQIQKIEEETNVVDSFFVGDSSDLVMKRYCFDTRA